MGMKKLLSKRFEVYLIDEYNTSKLFNKTGKEGENMKQTIRYTKEGKEHKYDRQIHSIFTFKMSKEYKVCINRDYNACLNMIKIVKELVIKGIRPNEFTRGKKSDRPRELD